MQLFSYFSGYDCICVIDLQVIDHARNDFAVVNFDFSLRFKSLLDFGECANLRITYGIFDRLVRFGGIFRQIRRK